MNEYGKIGNKKTNGQGNPPPPPVDLWGKTTPPQRSSGQVPNVQDLSQQYGPQNIGMRKSANPRLHPMKFGDGGERGLPG